MQHAYPWLTCDRDLNVPCAHLRGLQIAVLRADHTQVHTGISVLHPGKGEVPRRGAVHQRHSLVQFQGLTVLGPGVGDAGGGVRGGVTGEGGLCVHLDGEDGTNVCGGEGGGSWGGR